MRTDAANNDGQKNWEQPLVIAEPEINTVTISENDQFVLLACDGLYDVFKNEEIVSFVLAQMRDHGDAQKCCQVFICCVFSQQALLLSPLEFDQ